jgi:hypothetical protein
MFVYDYDSSSGTVTDDLIAAVPGGYESSELAASRVRVPRDRRRRRPRVHASPWVDVVPIDDVATNGQVLDVTFTSDTDGDYEVMFGATCSPRDDVADQPVTVPVTVDDVVHRGREHHHRVR